MQVSRGRSAPRRVRALLARRSLPSSRLLPTLLIAAWTLFSMAWVWSNPLGSAPDEPDHYIRALAAGYGDLAGGPGHLLPSDAPDRLNGYRSFTVPAGMGIPPQFACDAFHPTVPASCADLPGSAPAATEVVQNTAGTYTPVAYILPGLVMRLASDPYTALRLGRLASALLSLSALAAAALALWSRARSSFALLGLVVVVTPMQLFLLTEVGPDGLEIAAMTCFAAGLIALARPGPVSAWHWAAVAYGGVLVATTRPLGPEWLVWSLIVIAAFAGLRTLRERLLPPSRTAVLTGALVVVAAVFNLWWQRSYGVSSPVSISKALAETWANLNYLPTLLRQMVGLFGWLDTSLPDPLYALWVFAVVTLAVLAFLVADRRQRRVLAALAVVIVLLASFISAYISLGVGSGGTGAGVQGRYLMPLVVWFPLVCAEVLHLQRSRLGKLDPRRLTLTVAAGAAVVQLGAWWINSRRYAVGTLGHLDFIRASQWQPPGGWVLWLLVVLVATGVLLAFGVAGGRSDTAPLAAEADQDPSGTGVGLAPT